MSPRPWLASANRPAITNFATKSCATPSAASAPRNWRFRRLACKAASCRITANTACRYRRRLAVATVRLGSRPGGCPGPMRRSGSEEIGSPSRVLIRGAGGFSLPDRQNKKSVHFFGELPSGGPGLLMREDRPAAFAGRSEWIFQPGYPLMPTQGSILSRALHAAGRRQSEKSAGK